MTISIDKLTAEVWIDVVCPFSWIGLTRLKRAIAEFEHSDEVAVVHRASRLMPGAEPADSEAVLARKFGSLDAVRHKLGEISKVAAREGLTYDLAGTQLGDTRNVHRVLKLAIAGGLGDAVIERVFRGFYSEHASIFERRSLIALVGDAGLPAASTEAVLDSDQFGDEVESDQKQFKALGGSSTPFFVVGGKRLPPGQETASLTAALRQAWDARLSAKAAAPQ